MISMYHLIYMYDLINAALLSFNIAKILSSTTVFDIGNNKKCFFGNRSAY